MTNDHRDVDDELNVNTILLARRRRRLLLLFRLVHAEATDPAGGGGAFPRDRAEDRRHPPDLIHLDRLSLQPSVGE